MHESAWSVVLLPKPGGEFKENVFARRYAPEDVSHWGKDLWHGSTPKSCQPRGFPGTFRSPLAQSSQRRVLGLAPGTSPSPALTFPGRPASAEQFGAKPWFFERHTQVTS